MTAATVRAPGVPLFEPSLLRALRKISRGEIGAFGKTAPLGSRSADLLPIRLFSALFILRRDGLVALGAADARDGWCVAELTSRGTALLAHWNARLTGTSSHRIRGVGVVAPSTHLVETEDGIPRELSTPEGPVWIALCRAWVKIGETAAVDMCGRCVELARSGSS